MRFIKLFDSYVDTQYEKILYYKYVELLDNIGRENFTKTEIDIILKFIPYRFSDENKRYIDSHKVYFLFKDLGLFIDKCSDSWYLLQYTSNQLDYVFYKCDDLVGLENCLKHINIS